MRQLIERRFLRQEVGSLRARLGRELAERELVGTSPQMLEVKQTIASVANSDSPVLIGGESGTGKELVAAAIHGQSPRATGPFVPVNCGAIPAELMESEVFGHVRGAFSGAVADALGLARAAQGCPGSGTGLAPAAKAALMAYDFPGNVRELENLIERAYAFGAHDEITRENLPALAAAPAPAAAAAGEELPTLEAAERDLIRRALARYDNDKEKAARALRLTVRTLYRRINKFRLA